MSEVSVGWCFVLSFTNYIILFYLVSFLLVIACHLYMLLQKKEKKRKNYEWFIQLFIELN